VKVLLIRANQNEADATALKKYGIETVIDPYLSISLVPNQVGARKMLEALKSEDLKWLIITSTNVLSYWSDLLEPGELVSAIATAPNTSFAAIGKRTKEQLTKLGVKEVLVASKKDSLSLAGQIAQTTPIKVILPTGSISMKTIPETLEGKGFEIISEVVYHTEGVTREPTSVAGVIAGLFDCVILRSPSAARSFLGFNPNPSLKIVCAGATTAKEVEKFGLSVSAVACDPSPESLALVTFEALNKGTEID
jgi:uroporphyrinogen-III synthase